MSNSLDSRNFGRYRGSGMKRAAITLVLVLVAVALMILYEPESGLHAQSQFGNPTGGSSSAGLPTGLTYVAPTLTVSSAGNGNGVLALSGTTSGTATFTAPAVAGTTTNAVAFSNAFSLPSGTTALPSIVQASSPTTGISFPTTGSVALSTGGAEVFRADGVGITTVSSSPLFFSATSSATGRDTGISRQAATVVSIGTATANDESGLLRDGQCRITADITLPVNTATTICTWSLPAIAKAWAWQCEVPWVISAGSGTNTLAVIANPSQTPTGTTNVEAEILTTNANVGTEATIPVSASGATTILTSGTITPAATIFHSRTSGTLLASGTAGTFAIQMTAAGTTATAAAKAGGTCILY